MKKRPIKSLPHALRTISDLRNGSFILQMHMVGLHYRCRLLASLAAGLLNPSGPEYARAQSVLAKVLSEDGDEPQTTEAK